MAAGVKVTLIVHLVWAASELPQFEPGESVNCAASGPVTVIPVSDSAVALLLLSVKVLVALVFTAWFPKNSWAWFVPARTSTIEAASMTSGGAGRLLSHGPPQLVSQHS